MTIENHDFSYGENFFADEPYGILPECSCGWEGRGVATILDAQDAWENHCDAVFMEATTGGRESEV
jgi:hypothetical protein